MRLSSIPCIAHAPHRPRCARGARLAAGHFMTSFCAMRWLARAREWLSSLRPDRGDPEAVAEQRRVWQALAERHGLTHTPGPHAGYFQDDRIAGSIDGRDIGAVVFAAYDIQKLVVTVSAACAAPAPTGQPLRGELVRWYEERRRAADLPPIRSDEAPWANELLVGVVYLADGRLVYEQLYGIDEARLTLALENLPLWADLLERAGRA
jgi:hypothetical protein